MEANLQKVQARNKELQALLSEPSGLSSDVFQKLSKELAELSDVAAKAAEWDQARAELADVRALLADSGLDADMRQMAEQEERDLAGRLPEIERALQILLLPRDEADARNAILEVRAGTGGDEAALFREAGLRPGGAVPDLDRVVVAFIIPGVPLAVRGG